MSWWCQGSSLSRHVRGLRFDSRVRTLFSIDLCCIYLVFTMLFIFVKRMYIHGARALLIPNLKRAPPACTVKRGSLSTASCLTHSLTLIERAPPALHLRSYNIVHLCVLIVVHLCVHSDSRIMHEIDLCKT